MKQKLKCCKQVSLAGFEQEFTNNQLLRAKQIHAPGGILPISRSSFFDYVARGIIPKPIKLGPRTSCWRRSDILAFIEKMDV